MRLSLRAEQPGPVPGSPTASTCPAAPSLPFQAHRALFTESTQFITELHFHLHTNYFKELEQVGVGGGTGAPQEPRPLGQLPRTRAGEGALGRQSPGTSSPRAHAQQASSSSHINTDTLNKNSISSSQGIKTSLEYVQQRARGGQCCAGTPRDETGQGWSRGEREAWRAPGQATLTLAALLPRLDRVGQISAWPGRTGPSSQPPPPCTRLSFLPFLPEVGKTPGLLQLLPIAPLYLWAEAPEPLDPICSSPRQRCHRLMSQEVRQLRP